MSRAKRQPTATELEVLGNCITSASRNGSRKVKVKCVKDTGQQVFNILSQCLSYTQYAKGTGWGDFTMWFGSAENARQAKEDIDGWLAQYAKKVDSGDFGPQVDKDNPGGGGDDGQTGYTYFIIGAAVLIIAVILLRKKKKR